MLGQVIHQRNDSQHDRHQHQRTRLCLGLQLPHLRLRLLVNQPYPVFREQLLSGVLGVAGLVECHCDDLAGSRGQHYGATGMLINVVGGVVHVIPDDDPAVRGLVVFPDLVVSEFFEFFGHYCFIK
jgi:hypothetical protein